MTEVTSMRQASGAAPRHNIRLAADPHDRRQHGQRDGEVRTHDRIRRADTDHKRGGAR
jgi:hypothetical protein